KDVGRVAKWIRTINRNIALHVLRRKRIERKATQRLGAIKEASGGDGEAEREAEELRAAVIRAVDALPDSLRPVILLRHVEGLSYEQIAERLGIPLGTVKSRMARADSILQRKLRRFVRSFGEEGTRAGGASDAIEEPDAGREALRQEGGD
ncbi:MAG: sigma-70 family RNA polymerase sigma factor, partial [Planctomycetota bacterium]|nr:sigma-70 family RNA polymerase sigma factor [Planctomycetota bacterium]